MTITFKSLLLLALFAGNTRYSFGSQEPERKEVSADSYAVYSAVLAEHYRSWFKQKQPVLILPYTVLEPQGHQGCQLQGQPSTVVQELVQKLLAEKEEFRISAKFRLPGPYKMLHGKAEIRKNEEPGIVFLSAVEFSQDGSQAVVLVGHNCGGLCGDGYVLTLHKQNGKWRMSNDQLNCGWLR